MAKQKYVFMLYMNVFPDLDDRFIETFEAIAGKYKDNAGVEVFVLADRSIEAVRDPNSVKPKALLWNDTVIFRMREGVEPEKVNAAFVYPVDLDLGQQSALQGFVEYVYDNTESDFYFLSIWSHGSILEGTALGAFSISFPQTYHPVSHWAIAEDDVQVDGVGLFNQFTSQVIYHFQPSTSFKREIERSRLLPDVNNGILIMRSIYDALAEATKNKGKRMNMIGLDACCLGMIENMYELNGVTDYVIACENFISVSGLNYPEYIEFIYNNPSHLQSEFLEQLTTLYLKTALVDDMVSIVDFNSFNSFKNAFKEILAYVATNAASFQTILDTDMEWANYFIAEDDACTRSQDYDWPVVDLKFFLNTLNTKTNNPVFSALYQNFENAFNKFVYIAKANAFHCFPRERFGNNGLGIYYPNKREAAKADYLETIANHFPKFCNDIPEWIEFIRSKS